MSINIDSNRTTPVVRNQVMKEPAEVKSLRNTLIAKMNLLYHTWDSLDKVYQRKLPKNIELDLRAQQNAYYAESD